MKNVILNMSGVLWRRSVLEAALTAAGADIDRLKLAADWRLYIQACLLDISVSYIARPLNGHRRHEQGITMSLDKDSHLAELRQMQSSGRRAWSRSASRSSGWHASMFSKPGNFWHFLMIPRI